MTRPRREAGKPTGPAITGRPLRPRPARTAGPASKSAARPAGNRKTCRYAKMRTAAIARSPHQQQASSCKGRFLRRKNLLVKTKTYPPQNSVSQQQHAIRSPCNLIQTPGVEHPTKPAPPPVLPSLSSTASPGYALDRPSDPRVPPASRYPPARGWRALVSLPPRPCG